MDDAILQRQLQNEIAAERTRVIAESNRDEQAANAHAGETWSRLLASSWPFTLAREGWR
jgi:hypothetical protein